MKEIMLDELGLPKGYRHDPNGELTPRQVMGMLDDPASPLAMIDCRKKVEWELVHVPGSQRVPLRSLARTLGEMGLGRDADHPVAIICHHGEDSLDATKKLRKKGFTHVWSVAGGIDVWSMDVGRELPRYRWRLGRPRLLTELAEQDQSANS